MVNELIHEEDSLRSDSILQELQGQHAAPASHSAAHREECYAGGIGAVYCAIPAGISIDGELTKGCSVKCIGGYYACCDLRCKCVKY